MTNKNALRRAKRSAQNRFRRQKFVNLSAEAGIGQCRVVLDGVNSDFNIGKIFRSADAFGAAGIDLVSIPNFDPRSAMGSFQWVPARFHSSFHEAEALLLEEDYRLIALSPHSPNKLGDFPLPRKTAFILGHEKYGFSFNEIERVEHLSIPQLGRVESLNVSVAASIALFEYARQHLLEPDSEY